MAAAMLDCAAAEAIAGWMAPEELQWLAAHAQRAQTILEVGCYQGRSTRALADHSPGVIFAIDPWGQPYYREDGSRHGIDTNVWPRFAEHLMPHLKSGKVVAVPHPFLEVGDRLLAQLGGAVADLVFLDGDHRYATVRAEIALARRLLRPGGILAGHDYGHRSWPGVKRAVDEAYPAANHCRLIWWVTV